MPTIAREPRIHVAVGVVKDSRGRWLVARRPAHVHHGGKWEFPGGKIAPGETVPSALRREIKEEVGIDVIAAEPLICVRYDYPQRRVLLDAWRVTRFAGEPRGREGQVVRWVETDSLSRLEFPEGNRAIIAAAILPSMYAITDLTRYARPDMLHRLESALQAGLRLVQVRAKHLARSEYLDFAAQAISLCRAHDATALVNASPQLAQRLGAAGVHLDSRSLAQLTRRPLGASHWVAASCHDEREIHRAEKLGVDFVVVSPVRPTPSHPQACVLGWERFATLCEVATMPVFALGGMRAEDVHRACACGAQGVAMIRGAWE